MIGCARIRHPRVSSPALAAAALVAASLVSACAGETEIAGFDPAVEKVLPSQAVNFVNINPAIRMGAAYGNRGKGGHGSFDKFPAEFTTPFHTHSGAYHGIVIAGEKNPPEMSAGPYWYVPAGSAHATACVSKSACEFYFYAASAFDFTPVKK